MGRTMAETLEVADLRFVAYTLKKNICKTKIFLVKNRNTPPTHVTLRYQTKKTVWRQKKLAKIKTGINPRMKKKEG
jgi:hypothetical protein